MNSCGTLRSTESVFDASCKSLVSELPLVALILSALAVGIGTFAYVEAALSFDRLAIADGEYARLLTGHFTHWNADHLMWDVVMFAILGAVIERRSLAAFVSVLLVSAASVSAAIWFNCPEVVEYRGLSGIDSGLFAFAALAMYYDIRSANQRGAAWILLALSFAFVGKVFFEAATGSTIFVDSPAAGFTPLPITHAIGAASGVFVWLAIGRDNCCGHRH